MDANIANWFMLMEVFRSMDATISLIVANG